jgi:hypothetical protein
MYGLHVVFQEPHILSNFMNATQWNSIADL